MVELWFYGESLLGVARAELWPCLHGVMTPREQLPQCHSLVKLALLHWAVFDAFSNIHLLQLGVMGSCGKQTACPASEGMWAC